MAYTACVWEYGKAGARTEHLQEVLQHACAAPQLVLVARLPGHEGCVVMQQAGYHVARSLLHSLVPVAGRLAGGLSRRLQCQLQLL